MSRTCKAKLVAGFELKDSQISKIYESQVSNWSNGGAYVPVPPVKGKKKAYVIICNE